MMSDGKKFGKSDGLLSPEERLEEVERKYAVIQERIQTYDRVIEEFKVVNTRIAALKESQAESAKNIEKRIDELKDFFGTSAAFIANRMKELEGLDNKLTQLEAFHQQTSSRIYNIDQKTEKTLSDLQGNLSDSMRDLSKKSDVEFFKNHIKQVIENFDLTVNEFPKRLDALAKSISSISFELEGIKYAIDENKAEIETLASTILQHNVSNKHEISNLKSDRSNLEKMFKEEIGKSEQRLKEELLGTPSALEAVRADLLKRFEATALDSANSVLKGSNNERKIDILERKIENVALLLKKYELNK